MRTLPSVGEPPSHMRPRLSVPQTTSSVDTIDCKRCSKEAAALEKAPFRTELGERLLRRICRLCWSDWLQHQTLLINHYGLDPREASSKKFLYEQIEEVLLGDGEAEQVDTSRKGEIGW